jgi:phospholipase C
MTAKRIASTAVKAAQTGLISTMIFQMAIGSAFAVGQTETATSRDNATTTPIKHVIVIIGENRSFDHVFATYVPQNGHREG